MNNAESLIMQSDHNRQDQDCAKTTPWRTDEPPKDGKPIVAIGKLIYSDEFSTTDDPFCAVITWGSNRFEDIKRGWHFARDGMSLPQTPDDEVIIFWWLPYPTQT